MFDSQDDVCKDLESPVENLLLVLQNKKKMERLSQCLLFFFALMNSQSTIIQSPLLRVSFSDMKAILLPSQNNSGVFTTSHDTVCLEKHPFASNVLHDLSGACSKKSDKRNQTKAHNTVQATETRTSLIFA